MLVVCRVRVSRSHWHHRLLNCLPRLAVTQPHLTFCDRNVMPVSVFVVAIMVDGLVRWWCVGGGLILELAEMVSLVGWSIASDDGFMMLLIDSLDWFILFIYKYIKIIILEIYRLNYFEFVGLWLCERLVSEFLL